MEKHQLPQYIKQKETWLLLNCVKQKMSTLMHFYENQNNIKETWKGIRNLINISKKSTTNINKFIENGKEITNPNEMADTINTGKRSNKNT